MSSMRGMTAHTSRTNNDGTIVLVTRTIVILLIVVVIVSMFFIKNTKSEEIAKENNKEKTNNAEIVSPETLVENTKPSPNTPEKESSIPEKLPINLAVQNLSDTKNLICLDKKDKLPAPAELDKPKQEKTESQELVHIVEAGDTLEKISIKYYKTVRYAKSIFKRNQNDSFVRPNQLKIGQEIIVPDIQKLESKDNFDIAKNTEVATKNNIMRKPSKPSLEFEGTPGGNVRVKNKSTKIAKNNSIKSEITTPIAGKVVTHTVAKKDTVSSISKKYGVPVPDIIEVNIDILGSDPDCLREGTQLTICRVKDLHLAPWASRR